MGGEEIGGREEERRTQPLLDPCHLLVARMRQCVKCRLGGALVDEI